MKNEGIGAYIFNLRYRVNKDAVVKKNKNK